ncbi:hypothetical protein Tco_1030741 [Tanacetum coccineum]|uniref:Uncharacterized protein n=1 Tax=Tanacetum coccineum TaxID=301880 RepID=A0ABQ5G7K3_9ASTR
MMSYDESNTYVLERFNTTAGNPVKKILLKLNLSDHRLFKDGGGALALIATWFGTVYGFKDYYAAKMWFCSLFPGQRQHVERLFKKFTNDGLKFKAGAAIAMIGVGKGTEIRRLFGVPEPAPWNAQKASAL